MYCRFALFDDSSSSLIVLKSEIKWTAGGKRGEQGEDGLGINSALLLKKICDTAGLALFVWKLNVRRD